MPPVGFEPTISAGELPQTLALDRAATGMELYKWKGKGKVILLQARCGPEVG